MFPRKIVMKIVTGIYPKRNNPVGIPKVKSQAFCTRCPKAHSSTQQMSRRDFVEWPKMVDLDDLPYWCLVGNGWEWGLLG